MKNYTLYISLIVTITLVSCKKEEMPKPKVIYEEASKTKTEVPQDTTQVVVADLPINMDGTNYLIFPIGNVTAEKKGKLASSYESEDSFAVSNYSEYQITGYLKNLKFQEIGKDTIYALTDKNVLIETATYLKSIADKTKKQVMVYTLADMDTNKDNKLDNSDIKSLYLSDISGMNFTKISTDFQELIDWNVIDAKSRLFFRTIEDTNKNGEFDKEDSLHYFYINLLDKELKSTEYKPI
ncbi:MAG: hypothetical protein KAX93_03315 [Flavobacterium sp.]|nr:hypothetical protein [Flavobacterium sp.]MBP8157383.1 hypothetical protein [Flavobacterium sp.]